MALWQARYNILKINGESYPKGIEQFRGSEEDVSKLLKQGTKDLAERFDFAMVEVWAKNLDENYELHYKYESEGGFTKSP